MTRSLTTAGLATVGWTLVLLRDSEGLAAALATKILFGGARTMHPGGKAGLATDIQFFGAKDAGILILIGSGTYKLDKSPKKKQTLKRRFGF